MTAFTIEIHPEIVDKRSVSHSERSEGWSRRR